MCHRNRGEVDRCGGSVTARVRRVRQRMRKGGHSVPESDIRRRFSRSLQHLVGDYLPLADYWSIWTTTEPTMPLGRVGEPCY
jgi:predicted ABC-type ATPase